MGTSFVRSDGMVEWRLTARFTGHGSSISFRIPGTNPTVLTVIDRADMPITSVILRIDSMVLL